MATKNKSATAAPKKAGKAEALTAGQKAAATRKAKADAAATAEVSADVAVEPKVKAKAPAEKKVAPVKNSKAEAPDTKTPPKVAKAKVAKVEEPAIEVIENPQVGRKQLSESVRNLMLEAGFGVSPKLAIALVEKFEAAVEGALAGGNDVALPGFGTFSVSRRAGRTGRNPATGEAMTIEATWSVGFKVGKALKDAANTRPAA